MLAGTAAGVSLGAFDAGKVESSRRRGWGDMIGGNKALPILKVGRWDCICKPRAHLSCSQYDSEFGDQRDSFPSGLTGGVWIHVRIPRVHNGFMDLLAVEKLVAQCGWTMAPAVGISVYSFVGLVAVLNAL